MQWVSFIIILSLLIGRIFWPESIAFDKFSMSLVFLLAIPLLFPFLKKAKWFGAEFEFKENIKKTKVLVEKSEKESKQLQRPSQSISENTFYTFNLENVHNTVHVDPNLALAALRIEIERVLSKTHSILNQTKKEKILSLRDIIYWFQKTNKITDAQAEALNTITKLCNKAIHGADVTIDDAEEVISLTERLNNSFSFGYLPVIEANENYKENGLVCKWEHCIELLPFSENQPELSCPIFGHDCPGGIESRKMCKASN